MPEQSSSTQQLAALDLVWQLALEHEMNATKTAVAVSVLRKFAESQQERERAIGDALTARDADLAWTNGAQLGAEVFAAIASVGAEIVWPSPDSGDVADRSAADDTAPATGHEGERPPGESPVTGMIAGAAGGVSSFGSLMTVAGGAKPNPSAREKILAEVAAYADELTAPNQWVTDKGLIDRAMEFARSARGGGTSGRHDLIVSIAELVRAAERLDGAR